MLRRMAVILAIVAAVEIIGILMTPTYEQELAAAKAAYRAAESENLMLQDAVRSAALISFGN